MAIENKTERTGTRHRIACAGADDVRDRLLRAVKRNSSEEALQRLIEIAVRCVTESAAWDAFADAQEVGSVASWAEVLQLEREAHAAKQARIRVVNCLRAEIGD
jgi:hypothetical protein